jgi:hypothetical protein
MNGEVEPKVQLADKSFPHLARPTENLQVHDAHASASSQPTQAHEIREGGPGNALLTTSGGGSATAGTGKWLGRVSESSCRASNISTYCVIVQVTKASVM